MNHPIVVLCCGMIASGKGTFTSTLARRGAVVINDDSIVSAIHGGDHTLYRKELKSIYKTVEITALLSALGHKLDVVIDRPNFKKATRQRYLGIAKMHDIPVVCVTFPRQSPIVHAKRRFESDSRGLPMEHWIKTASRHHAEWEDPTIEEGFDNILPVDVAQAMIESGNW